MMSIRKKRMLRGFVLTVLLVLICGTALALN